MTEALIEVNQDDHIKVLIKNYSNYRAFEIGNKAGSYGTSPSVKMSKVLHLNTECLNEKPMETTTGL